MRMPTNHPAPNRETYVAILKSQSTEDLLKEIDLLRSAAEVLTGWTNEIKVADWTLADLDRHADTFWALGQAFSLFYDRRQGRDDAWASPSGDPTWVDTTEFRELVAATRTDEFERGDESDFNRLLDQFLLRFDADREEVCEYVAGANMGAAATLINKCDECQNDATQFWSELSPPVRLCDSCAHDARRAGWRPGESG